MPPALSGRRRHPELPGGSGRKVLNSLRSTLASPLANSRPPPALASGLAVVLAVSPARATPDNVRLVSATSGEVRFEVTAPAPRVAPAGGDAPAGAVRVDWPEWET